MIVTIRDLTKDDGISFKADITIKLPMEEAKLKEILGDDEWIIVDAPLGDEHTSILKLNKVCRFWTEKYSENDLNIVAQSYLFSEIAEAMDADIEFIIVSYEDIASEWNNGNGYYPSEDWLGLALFTAGYAHLPFKYEEAMEDYIRWDNVWHTAESEGWRHISYGGRTYMVNRR